MQKNNRFFTGTAFAYRSRRFVYVLNRRLWLLLGAVWCSAAMLAQTVTIGTANQTEMPPIKSNHDYSYTQQLYFQNEINQGGQITAIRFYFYGDDGETPTSLSNSNNWTIYMGHTTSTSISVGSFLPIGSMTQVFSGTISANPPLGWLTITLQTPFTYNNVNNLVIAVDENAAGNNGGTGNDWASVSIPGGPTRQAQAYGTTNINPSSPPGPNIAFAGMPWTGLVFGTPPSCVPSPTSPADASTLCGAQSVTLSWPAAPGATSYVVLLDDQPSLSSASIVGTVSGTSYNASTLAVGTWYWAIIPINASGQANNCFIWEFYIDPVPLGDKFANPIVIPSLPYTASSNNITALTCYTNDFGQPSPDVYYRFTTTACQSRVDISLCGAIVFNNYLHLLNAAGTTIATNDDNGPLCAGIAASMRMDNLPAGTYYIVVEGSGSAMGPYTLNVTASDISPPTITCPANIIQPNTSGQCSATVSFANATATDNCAASPTITNLGQASGSSFAVGTSSVTFRATDAAGNSATCSFTITVNDTQAPAITCPANIIQPNTTGQCNRQVSFGNASATDNCPGTPAITQIAGPVSGSVFPVGTTPVTFRATDVANNSSTCSFTVTINDTQAPTVTCPAAQTLGAGANCQAGLPNYTSLGTASDNCSATPAIQQSPAAGTLVSAGTQVLTFTTTDNAGLSSSCTFSVSVVDQSAPNITCPANIIQPNTTGQCSRQVSFGNASATDNCPGTPAITQIAGPVSGSVFPVGTTPVTFRATDVANNSSTCSFTVTINDTQAPTVTCPAAQTLVAGANCQAGLPNYTSLGTSSDNCTSAPAIQQSPAAGILVSAGAQVVTFTTTDNAGLSSSCTFSVSVVDQTAPSITCPAAQTVAVSSICQASLASYTALGTAGDNCTASPTKTQAPVAGAILTLGTSTVTLTATDGAGNTASCTFVVSVTDQTPPTISCPGLQTVAAGVNCQASLATYTSLGVAGDNCTASPTKTQNPLSGTSLALGFTVVTLTATDAAGLTATCTFNVSVTDQTPPAITCPASITTSTGPGVCSATVTYTVTSTDNCSGSSSTLTRLSGLASGSVFPLGMSNVLYRATDGTGNSSTCSFNVTVNDTQAPTISCPANQTLPTALNQCSAVATYTTPTASDNCSASTPQRTQGLASGSAFPVGANVVVYQTADPSGNPATCSFTVTVNDTQAPTISCPANQTLGNTLNQCSAVVTYTTPTASDNCSAPTPQRTLGLASGSAFPVGANVVVYQVTDVSGNSATCSFTVTVNDTQAPAISCPANQTLGNTLNLCSAVVTYTTPAVSDNCSAPTPQRTQGLASGSAFPIGANVVVYQATDASGNSATCSFTVTVNDTQAPAISCPANQTLNNALNQCSAVATYTAPSASDNCSVPTSQRTQGLPSGSAFPVGANVVVYQAVDASGNSATCSFTITVNDTQVPAISCPANQTLNNALNQCNAVATYTTPTASDNCSAPTPQRTQGLASGSAFPVGANVVVYQATDATGNSATCSFTVTVNDTQAPAMSCPANTTVNNSPANACSATATYTTPSATDNCGVASTVLTGGLASGSTFPVGLTTNTWRSTDMNGNSATCSFTVLVRDVTLPAITCPANQNITAGPTCTGTLGSWTPVALTDNCSPAPSFVQSPAASTLLSGHNDARLVTLTATDASGNTASCSFTVTLKDVTAPVAKCKNAVINLGSNGSVTVLPATVNNVSTDNCAFSLSVTPGTFGCGNLGTNTVTLKATDAGGNTSTCTAIVTIKDLTAPTALCKNINVFLDDVGHASITPAAVNNNSYDACGIATMSINVNSFDCGQIGGSPVTVQLTLKDVNNNISSCLASVYVKDVMVPTAICSNTVVHLSASGYASVATAPLAANSFDNCAVWSYSPVAKVYTTANLGVNNLSIAVKDYSNNSASCVSQVTVYPYGSGNFMAPNQPEHSNDAVEGISTDRRRTLELDLFPNPTPGESTVTFRLEEDQSCRLRLFDLNGRLVMENKFDGFAGENSLLLNLNELEAGMYLLDLQSDGWHGQRKLILQY